MAKKVSIDDFNRDDRVRFLCYTIMLCEASLKCAKLSKSEGVVDYVEVLQDRCANAYSSDENFELGETAEDRLKKYGFQVKKEENNRENISEKLNAIRKNVIEKKYQIILDKLNEDDVKSFELFFNCLGKYGISNFETIVNNPKSIDKNKLIERLQLDYNLLPKGSPIIGSLGKIIEEQISCIPLVKKTRVKINNKNEKQKKQENDPLRYNFSNHDDSKRRFLKLIGYCLSIGEVNCRADDIMTKELTEKYYDKVKEILKDDELEKDKIIGISKKMYIQTSEGIVSLKKRLNKNGRDDTNFKEDDYKKHNISSWIKSLRTSGVNNLLDLCLLSVQDKKEYESANDIKKEQMEAQYITVHHKIPLKYRYLWLGKQAEKQVFEDNKGKGFSDLEEDIKRKKELFCLNDISNLTLVIDGLLHQKLHEEEMKKEKINEKNGGGNYKTINAFIENKRDDMIILTNSGAIPFELKEPEEISKMRRKELKKVHSNAYLRVKSL